MTVRPDCAQCQILWDTYAAATNDHVKLEGKLQLAKLSAIETAAFEELTGFVEQAAARRANARAAFQEHERGSHSDTPPREVESEPSITEDAGSGAVSQTSGD